MRDCGTTAHRLGGLCEVCGYDILLVAWVGDMTNETTADRRARQGDALKAHFASIPEDAVKHLAFELREAAWTAPDVHRRVIEVFERHGVAWPRGDKP